MRFTATPANSSLKPPLGGFKPELVGYPTRFREKVGTFSLSLGCFTLKPMHWMVLGHKPQPFHHQPGLRLNEFSDAFLEISKIFIDKILWLTVTVRRLFF